MTFPPAPPERMRAQVHRGVLRRRDRAEHLGPLRRLLRRAPRPARAPYTSALLAAQEGRGSTASCRCRSASACAFELRTRRPAARTLYYQIDYTLEPELPRRAGHLHVTFRRENPTVLQRGLRDRRGPARARPLPRLRRRHPGHRPRHLVRRGRGQGVPRRRHRPADDLRHRARGLRRHARGAWARHHAPYAGAPLDRPRAGADAEGMGAAARLRRLLPLARARPDHVRARPEGHDPADRRRRSSRRDRRRAERATRPNPAAGDGLVTEERARACSRGASSSASTTTARPRYVSAREPQAVPASSTWPRLADIARLPYEKADPFEAIAIGAPAD